MIPGSERSPGEGNGNPFQYSCLQNPMDRGSHGGPESIGSQKSRTQLSTEQACTAKVQPQQLSKDLLRLSACQLRNYPDPLTPASLPSTVKVCGTSVFRLHSTRLPSLRFGDVSQKSPFPCLRLPLGHSSPRAAPDNSVTMQNRILWPPLGCLGSC